MSGQVPHDDERREAERERERLQAEIAREEKAMSVGEYLEREERFAAKEVARAEERAREAATERMLAEIDRVMQLGTPERASEMGRSIEPQTPTPWKSRDEVHDMGYSTEKGPVEVPPPGTPIPSLADRMLEEKRRQLERGLREQGMTREAEPTPPRYDSPERREAIQRHLESMGVDPHLRQVRELLERASGAPPREAVETRPQDRMTNRNGPGRGMERGRERDDRGRER